MSDFFDDADCPLFLDASPQEIIAQLAKLDPAKVKLHPPFPRPPVDPHP